MKEWRREIFKKISYALLLPISTWYASDDRKTKVDGIKLVVKKGVFHPKLFFSTRFLLGWLAKQDLRGKKVIELGSGSGLLSIYSAKQHAEVTASDISETACGCTKANAEKNGIVLSIHQSDLFTDIPWQQFDLVLINPPYYPKMPNNESEYAWFCGEDFEYFQKLFFQLGRYIKEDGKAIMVLSEDCKVDVIQSLAVQHNFKWKMMEKRKIWFEENYLFEIKL